MGSDGSRRMAGWIAACCLLAAALAMGLSACGGDSPAATAEAGATVTDGSSAAGAANVHGDPGRASSTTPGRAGAASGGACKRQLGDFLGSMAKLRTNLVAGVSYEQYVGKVGSIRSTYDAIPVDEVALGCLRAAGTPGEHSLNRYIAAGNTWSGCVEVPGCASESIEPALQSEWRQASKLLSKAQRGLRRLASG